MATLNLCTFIGHLGRDPVMNYTPAGLAVASFTLAVDEWKRGGTSGEGKKEKTTTWLDIVCFRELAETVNALAKKGSQVYVQGRLTKRTYTDRLGVERLAVEIIATDVQLLDPKPAATQAASPESLDPLGHLDEPF